DGTDCPAGRICSECGEGGIGPTGAPNLCKACFSIPYTAPNCGLSTEDAGDEVLVCTHSCPAAKAVLASGTPAWFAGEGLPKIALRGSRPALVECGGGAYADAGATAVDLCVGDISSTIVTTGGVDTSVTGTYSIGYSVTDASGLVGSAERTVVVGDTAAPA